MSRGEAFTLPRFRILHRRLKTHAVAFAEIAEPEVLQVMKMNGNTFGNAVWTAWYR
jgi:hypothetical protein